VFTAGSCYRCGLGLVREVRAEPALRLGERDVLAGGVVLDLVAADATDREVPGRRVREVHAADARAGGDGVVLGQLEARLARAEQVEELRLLAVVGAGRVAERGPDPEVALADDVLAGELLGRRVPGVARLGVQPLGEGFGQAVGE